MSTYIWRSVTIALRASPMKSCLLVVCLVLAGFDPWERLSPLPASDWNLAQVSEIKVADPGDICFAVFGDVNDDVRFESILQAIDHDPDTLFALCLGDFVHKGEKKRYRRVVAQVKNLLGIPLLTVVGERETRGGGTYLFNRIFGRDTYSFRIGANLFVVLNDVDPRGIESNQIPFLEQELAKGRNCLTRLIFMHLPLYDRKRGESFRHGLNPEASEKLLRVFKRYNATHIFAAYGADGYAEGQWDGIPYTLTGGGRAGQEGDRFSSHFVKARLRGGMVAVEARPAWFSNPGRMGASFLEVWLPIFSFLRLHVDHTALLLIAAVLGMGVFCPGPKSSP